jgi:hypothetical protein
LVKLFSSQNSKKLTFQNTTSGIAPEKLAIIGVCKIEASNHT